jgi:hypothetical protein
VSTCHCLPRTSRLNNVHGSRSRHPESFRLGSGATSPTKPLKPLFSPLGCEDARLFPTSITLLRLVTAPPRRSLFWSCTSVFGKRITSPEQPSTPQRRSCPPPQIRLPAFYLTLLPPLDPTIGSNMNTKKPKLSTTRTSKTLVTPCLTPLLASTGRAQNGCSTPRVGLNTTTSTLSVTPSITLNSTRPPSTIDGPAKEQGAGLGGFGTNGSQNARGANRPRTMVGGNHYTSTPSPRPPLGNIYNHPVPRH